MTFILGILGFALRDEGENDDDDDEAKTLSGWHATLGEREREREFIRGRARAACIHLSPSSARERERERKDFYSQSGCYRGNVFRDERARVRRFVAFAEKGQEGDRSVCRSVTVFLKGCGGSWVGLRKAMFFLDGSGRVGSGR